MRSHDLNRLLDEPGQTYLSSENIFSRHIAREGPWGKPSPTMTTIQTIIAMVRCPVVLILAEPSHSTRWALVRWC